MSRNNTRDRAADTATSDAHVETTPLPSSSPMAPLAVWSSLTVRTASRGLGAAREVTGPQRLALLYLWYRDNRPPRLAAADVTFHPMRGGPLSSPGAVDWSGFPWADAVTAVGTMGGRGRIPTPLSIKTGG